TTITLPTRTPAPRRSCRRSHCAQRSSVSPRSCRATSPAGTSGTDGCPSWLTCSTTCDADGAFHVNASKVADRACTLTAVTPVIPGHEVSLRGHLAALRRGSL